MKTKHLCAVDSEVLFLRAASTRAVLHKVSVRYSVTYVTPSNRGIRIYKQSRNERGNQNLQEN
jgi:hypothetical protein